MSLSSSSFLPFGGSSARKKSSSPSLGLGSPPAPSQSSSPPSLSSPFAPPLPPAASTLRDLVFRGSISIQINLHEPDLPPHADRSVETLFMQAPRISYLPLLLDQVRKLLLNLVLDPSTAASIDDDKLWFDCNGIPLKWHWPIGLLYDFHTAHSSSSSSSTPQPSPSAPFVSTFNPPPSTTMLRTTSLTSTISTRAASAIQSSQASYLPPPSPSPLPWKLTLHLKDPPVEALLMSASIEACRGGFMNMLKEADFVRWGSVKRVTNLRKEQQDALWEGVVRNDFDQFWAVASKLVPLPSAPSPNPSRSQTPSGSGGAGSGSTTPADGRVPEANSMRSVPVRVYLPEGAPVLQDVVSPLVDGNPTTLLAFLTTLIPLFFPPYQTPLARALVHGVSVPLETEMGWLGACLAGADGWVAVVVVLGR